MKRTLTIDFDAVYCNPRHLNSCGKGWAKRLRALGASDGEAEMLADRLKAGMAAQIELQRIYALAGIAAKGDGSGMAGRIKE